MTQQELGEPKLPIQDLIRQIPDFAFDEREVDKAVRDGIKSGNHLLGTIFTTREIAHSLNVGSLSNHVLDFQAEHPWLLLSVRKKNHGVDFAYAFYSSPDARKWVENINPETGKTIMDNLVRIGGNLDSHIQRLLTHYDPETHQDIDQITSFTLHLLDYIGSHDPADPIYVGFPPSSDAREDDYPNAAYQFWTIAPYLYDELQKRGLEKERAIEVVLNWGFTREPQRTADAEFPGMKTLADALPWAQRSGWILGKAPNTSSHQLAQKVGAHIAEHIAVFYR